MTKATKSKTVPVKQHLRHVPISRKNPSGLTTVHKHLRHIDGQYLNIKMIDDIFAKYNTKNIIFPSTNFLGNYNDQNTYNDMIAVWIDYFNQKLNIKPLLDVNMFKALIASESSFDPTAKNKTALGITQITKETLKIIQDLDGEAKDFVFKDIQQKDLKKPNVSIALAARWLAQKQKLAKSVLGRNPTADEVIMQYKGILKDESENAKKIMKNYREKYAALTKK